MASVSFDSGGLCRIQFADKEGRRKTIRPGKIDAAAANEIRKHIELILLSQSTGTPLSREVMIWTDQLRGTKLHERIKRTGILPPDRIAAFSKGGRPSRCADESKLFTAICLFANHATFICEDAASRDMAAALCQMGMAYKIEQYENGSFLCSLSLKPSHLLKIKEGTIEAKFNSAVG
jgi:hypothetical protein